LNQYGGGVPGAPNGGHRRACAVFHVFRAGRHPCGGAGVVVRRRRHRRRRQAAACG